jgi:alkylated DNA repair dioxygenase AlkB
MSMNWHADDEVGVGKTIASLSLGASCQMEFCDSKENPYSRTFKLTLEHVRFALILYRQAVRG